MSKTATYALPREAEELLFTKVIPTGTSHTLTLVVTEDPVTKLLSLTISNPRLEIKNGDKVTWNVSLPLAYDGWEVDIQFKGKRFMDRFAAKANRSVPVPGDILGYTGTFQDSKEPYSVTLVNGTSTVTVPYPTSSTDPTPYLVIDDIGDPPPKKMSPKGSRWGYHRKR